MKKGLLALAVWMASFAAYSQQKSPYQLFSASGKKTKYKKLVKQANDSDIVFFGELHNNSIAHWLQLELTQDLFNGEKELVLGAEMFEADNQVALDTYLSGGMDEDSLTKRVRLWPNYSTDYAPLVHFARANKIPFVATNVPRPLASAVFKGGFEALSELDSDKLQWAAPQPIHYNPNLPGYRNMLDMMPGHGGENLPKAQAIKDATMAHFMLKNYKSGHLFIHFNGAYHSDRHGVSPKGSVNAQDGIPYYVLLQRPELKLLTITTVTQENIQVLEPEHIGKADFIVVVDEDMTNTYEVNTGPF